MKNIRSPLFYVGDKFKIIEEIKKYFPKKINKFIEPFTGGGTVFLNIKANKYILNDIDKNIYSLHNFLLENSKDIESFFININKIINKYKLSKSYIENIVPDKLKKKYVKTYYAVFNKEGYNELKAKYNKSKSKNLFELYILLIYGFNRILRFNSNGLFNLPVGNVDFNTNVYSALNNYFNFVIDKKIEVKNLDFHVFLKKIKFEKDDFVYLDPPYLISFSEYNKLWDVDDEKRLLNFLDLLNKNGVKFAISNVVYYKDRENLILKDWMKKYNVYEIKSNYISYHNNSQKNILEVLITNYGKKIKNNG